MNKPIIRIHNVITDEVIDREMNDAEFAQHNKMLEETKKETVEVEAKATAKAALLKKLGITEAEAELLLA